MSAIPGFLISQMHSFLVVLLLIGLLGIAQSSLWENKFALEEDLKVLQRGSNLIYLTVGDFEHNVAVAQELTKSFEHQVPHCVDICSGRDILPLLFEISEKGPGKGGEVVVIHGIESIAPNERRVMDFAYRLTDSSSELSNVVVLFVVESGTSVENQDSQPQISPPANHTQQLELKLVLAEALNEDSVFFNGHAFTGRLARTSFQPGLSDIKLSAAGCHRRAKGQDICNRLSNQPKQATTSTPEDNNQVGFVDSGFCPPNKATKVVLLGVFLAILYIAVYCWCKNNTNENTGKRTNEGNKSNSSASVAAQVVSHSGAASNLYTGASSSGFSQVTSLHTHVEQSYSYEDNVHRTPECEPRVRQSRSNKHSATKSLRASTKKDSPSTEASVVAGAGADSNNTPQRPTRTTGLRSAGKTK